MTLSIILLICFGITYYSVLPRLKAVTKIVYTQGYNDGQHELKNELSNTREELKYFRLEMQSMKEIVEKKMELVEERMKTTERYRAEIGIKQSAFLLGIEDWFDLRRSEMREMKEEQMRVLGGLKAGGTLVGGDGVAEKEEKSSGMRTNREVQMAGKLVNEKRKSRSGNGWAGLKAGRK